MRLKNVRMILSVVLLNCLAPSLTCSPEEKNNRMSDRSSLEHLMQTTSMQHFHVLFDSYNIPVAIIVS